MATTVFTQQSGQIEVDALLMGTKWGGALGQGATVTFSFPGVDAYWDPASYGASSEPYLGFVPFDETQKVQVRIALSNWSEVANITFVEVAESQELVGDLRYAFSGLVPLSQASAYAYYLGNYAKGGDVWFDPNYADLHQYAYMLLHETGHAIGLKHSFNPFGSWPAVSSQYGNAYTTVVSYFDSSIPFYVNPVTPMAWDIAAMRYLYGLNPFSVRPEDNDYLLSLEENLKSISAIDSDGTDRISVAAGSSWPYYINLNEGTWSGANEFGSGNVIAALIYVPVDSRIEQAVGGQRDDSLTGNALDNLLVGGLGDETLEGGSGLDTAVFSGVK